MLQGGGAGGDIRSAGGSFGKMEAAHEEEYFRRLVSIKELNILFKADIIVFNTVK